MRSLLNKMTSDKKVLTGFAKIVGIVTWKSVFMILEFLLLFGHLPPQFVYNHINGAIKVIRDTLRFVFASAFHDLDVDDALVPLAGKDDMHIHRLHFEFEKFFEARLKVLNQGVAGIHV